MLSLSNVGTGKAAATYYEGADDYYAGNSSPSEWWGEGAATLGLSGSVDQTTFANLLDGQLPTGELLHHAAAGRRGGTDATFSAPKSVSLQALVGSDHRLLEAHARAVDRALAYAENLAACRVTEGGNTRSERSGNLIVARFDHDLSRACDPQLHTHCVLVNATRRADGQWRALDNEALYRHKMLLGALYRSELAREVQNLGYQVRMTNTDGRFELRHIEDRQVRAFSQRSAAIETYLKDQGRDRSEASAWTKKLIAVVTREKKTAVDREVLRQDWVEISQQQGIDYSPTPVADRSIIDGVGASDVVAEAVDLLGEREAVFGHADLLRVALERGTGIATLNELNAAIEEAANRGLLVRCGDHYTTKEAQQREAEILAVERAGRDTLAPIYAGDPSDLVSRLNTLNHEQQQASRGVLLTRHQVIGIQGRAGVGKTTLLAATTKTAVACGYKVLGLAPSASAARELASTGMAAETIATFMQRERKGLNAQTILVVDEAGMVSTQQMLAVLRAAKDAGCRVVLVGDTAQLAAVEAGKPFAQLQAHGMATSLVGQIQRQKNPLLKQAVEHAVNGNVAMAVDLLNKEITQIVSASERFDRIAADYLALSPEDRLQTRVVAGTRYARAEINARIRGGLGLADAGHNVELLIRKDLTDVERRSTLSYDEGDLVKAEVDYSSLGMKRGDVARVVARLDHRILLEKEDGSRVAWQPATMNRLTAFTSEERMHAVGDHVRFTENDRGRGLVNGDLAMVTDFNSETKRIEIELADGRIVSLDGSRPLTMDYGYCSTVYGAQGQTCDRVMIEADANSLTASQATFYVAISRAREVAKIYTDDREMLPLAMGRQMEKSSALDIKRPEVTFEAA